MLSRWFLTEDIPLALCTPYHYDRLLVVVSYLVAAFAAYTAFDLIGRVRAAPDGPTRLLWLITAGFSMGFGIWAMHFIAMLAVETPIPIRFDLPITALSAGFAVFSSAIAFHLVAEDTRARGRLCLAGIVLGVGIGLMHYTGMAAMRMPAHVFYNPWMFALSVVVAVGLSTVALFALTARPRLKGSQSVVVRLTGAAVMGLAIVLMHYTGMLATYFYPEPELHESGVLLDPPIMAAAIAVISLLIVGLALAAAWLDRRKERAETLLHDAIESFSEGFVVYDQEDRLVMCNRAYREMYSEGVDLLVPGTHFAEIAWRGLSLGKYPDARGHEDAWLETRMRRRRDAIGSFEEQLSDGSWMLTADRRMSNGATAGLRIDISTLKAAQAALRDSEQRLDQAQEIAGIGSWEVDARTGRRVWSKEMYRIRGILDDEDAPTVDGLARFTHSDDCPRLYEWLEGLKQGIPQDPIEYRIVRPDGLARTARAEGRAVADATGEIHKIAGTLQDVTERRRTERQLDVALNNLTQGVCFFDGEHRLILANRRYAEIYDLSMDTIRPGTKLEEIVDRRFAAGTFPDMTREEYLKWRASIAISAQPNDTIVELKSGQVISIHHRPMPDGGWISTHEDITERRRAEARLAHMARHDALTGLPNRVVFREYLDQKQDRRGRGDGVAVLCLDLDRFKYVNDTFGHATGDELLCGVAERIVKDIRAEDVVVRLGGDEFAIVQPGVDQPSQATALAGRLIDILSQPYDLGKHQVTIGASVGIAYCLNRGADAETLLKNADMALYRAKANGRGTFCFFDPIMNMEAHARHTLEAGLRAALSNEEFELFFQPILNAHTEGLIRFEALVRWRHPGRGLIAPSEFIPLAEEIGLIIPLGEWILREACQIAVSWPDNLSVAVNISATQLKSAKLVNAVRTALLTSRLPPSRLELEITETVLLENSSVTLEALRDLRDLGLRISLDDFGTGFSSISCLRSFPFDKLKIDRSFIRDLDRRADSVAIVHAIVDLACALGMSVTAEGVETAEQLRLLRAESCTEVQGFLFSPPVPKGDIPSLIARFSSATAVTSFAH
jgi:diguanylate cyclase (GGDEF)-like protein/PAS domain S-box-containing protein